MEAKTNFHLLMEHELMKINRSNKPRLLLHACCGPCAVYPLIFLNDYFSIVIFFNNSNIYPEEEYNRRLKELIRVQDELRKDYGIHIEILTMSYENSIYNRSLQPYATSPEGGLRCQTCYTKRMEEAFKYASENNYGYYTTVMTISRQKNSQVINRIGAELQKKFPNVQYLFSDFKKKDGLMKAKILRLKYNLYQQQYCGCRYSYEVYLKKKNPN